MIRRPKTPEASEAPPEAHPPAPAPKRPPRVKPPEELPDTPAKPGRPTLPPGQAMVVVPIRLTHAQKATLQRVGVQAVRDWLDLVTPPPAP